MNDMEFNTEATEEEIEWRKAQMLGIIQAPRHTGKSWFNMTPEEQQRLREYYDTTDLSEFMEKGEWVYPDHQSGTIEESIQRGLDQVARGEVRELDLGLDADDENDDLFYPVQLELDLGVVPIQWDENTRFSEVKFNMIFDHELSVADYNALCDAILDVLDEHFPCDFMSAKIRSGTDRELFPEEYDESEKSDGTDKEEM